MGLCISKPSKSASLNSPFNQSEAGSPRSTGALPSSSLYGASQSASVISSLFNPSSDPRIDRLIELIGQLYSQSATLR